MAHGLFRPVMFTTVFLTVQTQRLSTIHSSVHQGFIWYLDRLVVDEDGDYAHEFFEVVGDDKVWLTQWKKSLFGKLGVHSSVRIFWHQRV